MNAEDRYDLAIVGGGIVGAMVSHCARRMVPRATQIVFERYRIGAGATLLSGGLMPLIGASRAAMALAKRSRAIYGQLFADGEAPVKPQPAYWIFPQERAQELFVELGRSLPEGEARRELSTSYPFLRVPSGYGVARDDSVWVANSEATARSLIARGTAQRSLVEGVSVERIEEERGGFVLHRGDGVCTRSRRVVLAPGPWVIRGPSAQWARERGLRLKRTVCLHLAGEVARDAAALLFHAERAFLLPLPGLQQTLLSYTADEWDVAPLQGELEITPRDRELALNILARFLPERVADYSGGQVFCDAYTPEKLPMVEILGGQPGCVVVGGCSGAGVRFAPGLAERAVELAWR